MAPNLGKAHQGNTISSWGNAMDPSSIEIFQVTGLLVLAVQI